MKKLLLVLTLVLLVLTLGLAACGKNATTKVVVRWRDGERYEFKITKADLQNTADKSGYRQEYFVSGEDLSKMDEVVPDDVSGTFVMEIKVNEDNTLCTLETKLTVVALYHKYYAGLSDSIKTQLQEAGLLVSEDDMKNTWFDEEAYGQAIKSTTVTSVTFNNDTNQRPVSSTKEYNGYYFGKTKQEVSASTIEVDYSKLSKNKIAVTVDGKKETREVKLNKNSNVIDANQILLYLRSLDKSDEGLQNSPSVQVYDPIYNKVRTATFSRVDASFKTYLSYTHEKNVGTEDEVNMQVVTEDVKAKLSCVAAVVDGQVLMVEMDLPASLNTKDNPLDVYKKGGYSKFTTVRFRTGFIAYELADYDEMLRDYNGEPEGAKIIAALQIAAQKK